MLRKICDFIRFFACVPVFMESCVDDENVAFLDFYFAFKVLRAVNAVWTNFAYVNHNAFAKELFHR